MFARAAALKRSGICSRRSIQWTPREFPANEPAPHVAVLTICGPVASLSSVWRRKYAPWFASRVRIHSTWAKASRSPRGSALACIHAVRHIVVLGKQRRHALECVVDYFASRSRCDTVDESRKRGDEIVLGQIDRVHLLVLLGVESSKDFVVDGSEHVSSRRTNKLVKAEFCVEKRLVDDALAQCFAFAFAHMAENRCKAKISHWPCVHEQYKRLTRGLTKIRPALALRTFEELLYVVKLINQAMTSRQIVQGLARWQVLSQLLFGFRLFYTGCVAEREVLLELCRNELEAYFEATQVPKEEREELHQEFVKAVEHVRPAEFHKDHESAVHGRLKKSGGWRKWIVAAVCVAVSVLVPMEATAALAQVGITGLSSALISGALTGTVNGVITGQRGISLLRSALAGAISAGGSFQVGETFQAMSAGKLIAHGTVSGVSSVVGGGKFVDGFIGGVVAESVAGTLGDKMQKIDVLPAGVATAIVAGASSAAVSMVTGGGGKEALESFGRGFATGYFNHAMHQVKEAWEVTDKEKSARTLDALDCALPEKEESAFWGWKLFDEATYYIPLVGEARSAYDAVNCAMDGNWAGVAASALGAIPVVSKVRRVAKAADTAISMGMEKLTSKNAVKDVAKMEAKSVKVHVGSRMMYAQDLARHDMYQKIARRPTSYNYQVARDDFLRAVAYEVKNPHVPPVYSSQLKKSAINAVVKAVDTANVTGSRYIKAPIVNGVRFDCCHKTAHALGGANHPNNFTFYSTFENVGAAAGIKARKVMLGRK